MEAAKGVIWERDPVEVEPGVFAYKYVIALVLVTSEPIPAATTTSHVVHLGAGDGEITAAINRVMQGYRAPRIIGDAHDVLVSCHEWSPRELERMPPRSERELDKPALTKKRRRGSLTLSKEAL